MATVLCEKGHLFDDRKHINCPYCAESRPKDELIRTQANPSGRPGVSGSEISSRHSGNNRLSIERSDTPGPTLSFWQKRAIIQPIVGWLVCIEGKNKGRDYRLYADLNKVGRAPNMDVCIEGDETISRENHCFIAFSRRSRTFNVVPGTGRNLIYLNDEDALSPRKLAAYDRLNLGESSFLFMPFCTDQYYWEQYPEVESSGEPDVEGPPHRPSDAEIRGIQPAPIGGPSFPPLDVAPPWLRGAGDQKLDHQPTPSPAAGDFQKRRAAQDFGRAAFRGGVIAAGPGVISIDRMVLLTGFGGLFLLTVSWLLLVLSPVAVVIAIHLAISSSKLMWVGISFGAAVMCLLLCGVARWSARGLLERRKKRGIVTVLLALVMAAGIVAALVAGMVPLEFSLVLVLPAVAAFIFALLLSDSLRDREYWEEGR